MSKYDLLPCTHEKHVNNSDCYYAHKRLAVEEKMVRGLIRGLKRARFLPVVVNDTEELGKVRTETETLDAVFAVDYSAIGFEKGKEHHTVQIVLGNGVDCIPDWNYTAGDPDGFNAAMERITDDLYAKHEEA